MTTQEEEQEMLDIFRQGNDKFYLGEFIFTRTGEAGARGEYDEQEGYLRESLAISQEIGDFDGVSGRMVGLGGICKVRGDYQRAENMYREAIAISQKVKSRLVVFYTQIDLADLALAQGKYLEADLLSQGVLEYFQEMNYHLCVVQILLQRMVIAWSKGDYGQALQLGREVSDRYRDLLFYRATNYYYLARIARLQGDLRQAGDYLSQAASLCPAWAAVKINQILYGWGVLFSQQGKPNEAAHVMGAADKIYQRFVLGLPLIEREENAQALAAVRASLGEDAYIAAWEEGKAMTLDQALAYAKEHEG